MNKIEKGELIVARFRIPYVIYGTGENILLTINGAQQSIATYFSIARYFTAEGGFRVISFDFPGQGRAVINTGINEVCVEEQLEVINAIANRFSGGKPFNIISASWGNVIAVIYSSRFPERVTKLLLGSFAMKANNVLMDTVVKGRKMIENGNFAAIADMFADVFGRGLSDEKKQMVQAQFRQLPGEHFRQLHKQSDLFYSYSDLAELTEMNNISAETIIINGSEDTITDIPDAERALNLISNCDFCLVEGVGHFLHFENNELISLYYDFFAGSHHQNKFYNRILNKAI